MTNNVHLAIMDRHLIVRILMGTLIHFNFEIVSHIQEYNFEKFSSPNEYLRINLYIEYKKQI